MDALHGGLYAQVPGMVVDAVNLRRLKKKGYRYFGEVLTSEIDHVISHKKGGYTLFINPKKGNLNQVGFTRKTDELRRYLKPFRMDPNEWERYRKEMIKWKKAEKRGW